MNNHADLSVRHKKLACMHQTDILDHRCESHALCVRVGRSKIRPDQKIFVVCFCKMYGISTLPSGTTHFNHCFSDNNNNNSVSTFIIK